MKLITKHFQGNSLKAQLLKGVTGSAGLKAANTVLTMTTGVLLARTLGPEDYGVYAFVLSIVALLGLPTKAGLPTLIVRETAKNQLKEQWGLLRGLLALANGFVLFYSIAVASVAALAVWWLWGAGESTKIQTFLWALWLLPLIAFGNVRSATLRGLRRVVQGQLPEEFVRPVIMIILLAAALVMDSELNPIQAIQYNVIAALAAFGAGAFLLVKSMPQGVKTVKSEYQIKAWSLSLLPLSLFAGLKIADSQVAIVILGSLASSEDVGFFRVAATGAGLVAFGLTSVNMALAPQVARLYSAGDLQKLQRVITVSTRAVLIISLPVALVLILWGDVLIKLVFGAEYIPAATSLAILCIGQLVNTSCGSVALILNMTGHDKETAKSIVAAMAINVSLSLLLVPLYGLNGAAVSSAMSLTAWNLILMRLTYKCTGLRTFAFRVQTQEKK